jgi:hypothetical protein
MKGNFFMKRNESKENILNFPVNKEQGVINTSINGVGWLVESLHHFVLIALLLASRELVHAVS